MFNPDSIAQIASRTALACLMASMPNAAHSGDSPWRLSEALGLSDRVFVSGQHRVRFESLDNQFRAGRDGGDQILVTRTTLMGQLNLKKLTFAAELLDAREALADGGTPISTGEVNPLELLQAYVEMPVSNLLQPGSTSSIRGGRLTMDVGCRRLVVRNNYRNTINSFTGIDWQWTGADNRRLRLFYTLPVQRRAGSDLLHAEAQFDRETSGMRFWGAYYAPPGLPWRGNGEIYFYGLNENDTPEFATRNRNIYTAGLRLHRTSQAGKFNYELESVYQFGESRASTSSTDVTNLDHSAHFQHFELGYTFPGPWQPQIIAQYDYASGDDDPGDGDNNQFDTLFGGRRFDFGPTSIYGAFARANLNSPAVRVHFTPADLLKALVAVRGFWLASSHDAWTAAGIRDTSGASGNYIGTQIEARLQWAAVPGNLDIEAGIAHILDGDIMKNPPGNGAGDVIYFYTQALVSF